MSQLKSQAKPFEIECWRPTRRRSRGRCWGMMIVTSARRQAAATRKRATSALRRMDTTGAVITFETVAREAGVSRTWLYNQPDLRAELERLRARHRIPATRPVPDRQRASDT